MKRLDEHDIHRWRQFEDVTLLSCFAFVDISEILLQNGNRDISRNRCDRMFISEVLENVGVVLRQMLMDSPS